MWVYIKIEQENSYYPHLIEHMVIWGYGDLEHYFDLAYGVSGTSWVNYTSFYLPPILGVDKFLAQIFSPLDCSILEREKRMIQEEMSGWYGDATLLVNRLGKELYGEKFRWAAASSKVSKKRIFEQHQKFYNEDYLWIVDDEFRIVSRPKNIKENNSSNQNSLPVCEQKKIRWDIYFYLLFEGNCFNYALVYFLDWILWVWGEYSSNYQGRSYESKIWREFFEYENHLLLLVDQQTQKLLHHEIFLIDFFERAKERFIETEVILNEIALIAEISYWKIVAIEDLKIYLQSLEYKQICDFLRFNAL